MAFRMRITRVNGHEVPFPHSILLTDSWLFFFYQRHTMTQQHRNVLLTIEAFILHRGKVAHNFALVPTTLTINRVSVNFAMRPAH